MSDARCNEHHVYLSVGGFDDANEVTQLMRVEPSRAWNKGDADPASSMARRFSRWMLQSALPLTETVDVHLRQLLLVLEGRREELAIAAKRFQVHLAIVVYCHAHNPVLYIEADLLERIARLSIDLDFDVYCLFEEKAE